MNVVSLNLMVGCERLIAFPILPRVSSKAAGGTNGGGRYPLGKTLIA